MTAARPLGWLWRDDVEEYRCSVCGSRVLRVGTYGECLGCGRTFRDEADATVQTELADFGFRTYTLEP